MKEFSALTSFILKRNLDGKESLQAKEMIGRVRYDTCNVT
jgi:hypothetical protein